MKSKSKEGGARTIYGQRSWRVASKEVEAYVTQTGGHLAPVTFNLGGRQFQPYSVAPWAEEKLDPSLPPLLKVLRGDFFCLPFGGNSTAFRGEQHPPHGETANKEWHFEALELGPDQTSLHLSMETTVRPGRVDKNITLMEGHSAIYSRHVISGMKGPMNPGHHATLRFPEAPGSGRVSTSPFVHGQVLPLPFELPEQKGYSSLKVGATFTALEQVPLQTGEMTDLSVYPARRGYEDLVLLANDTEAPFTWTAVTFPKERSVWFALKNPRVLRETILWISNGGRHYPPWNGRHINVMGLEEVTSYFHLGLAESARPNPLSKLGYATSLSLDPRTPLTINYIMGMAVTPAGFDRVVEIEPMAGQDSIRLLSASGKRATAQVALGWLELEER